jgi:SNF2 family DNA or RNA helicase
MITTYGMVKAHSRVAGYGNISLKKCIECKGKDPNIDIKKCEKHVRELNNIPWQTVVVDEGQRIRNPKTPQTRSVWAVAEGAKNRWILTGTPIESSPMDFWTILHFIAPNDWPTSTKFRDRLLNVHQNYFGGVEILGVKADMLEEFKYLTGARWMRREHMDLPPVVEEYRYSVLSPKERKAYKQMHTQLMAQDENGEFIVAENHMVKQGRLMQLANSTIVVGSDSQVYPSEPSSKLDLLMDTLENRFAPSEPLVVWFDHVGLLQMASARLAKAEREHTAVYGAMSSKSVDKAVQDFQEGRSNLILLSQSKGGTGITLTRARVSIHVEHNPSRILDSQTHGRTRRIGSEHHENILRVHLIAKDTVEEELVFDKLPGKYDKAEEITKR